MTVVGDLLIKAIEDLQKATALISDRLKYVTVDGRYIFPSHIERQVQESVLHSAEMTEKVKKYIKEGTL